jgi:ceramide glucosyltransferase
MTVFVAIFTNISLIIEFLLIVFCLVAIWFYGYAIYGAWDYFVHPQFIDPTFEPPVTILKPLCGLDEDAYENLASFCQQDYPQYQTIFGVQNSTDPSIEVVQQLISQFPKLDIQLVVSDRSFGANPKVNNLINASTQAKHDIWLIADSDIRVGQGYLKQVVQPLSNPLVGVVTCPYRSIAQGWVTVLEALRTATDFHAGVFVARKLEGMKFAFGSTILIRQSVLEKIGGLSAIADYLADDFQLGHLPATVGYQVVLSDYIVEHILDSSSLLESLQRQIRWARGIRVSRPWGYLGTIFTYGTVTSLLLLLATGGSVLGWVVLSLLWTTRLAMGWIVGAWCLQDVNAQRFWWLIPLGDCLTFSIWLCGFVGNTIEWRGQRLKLTKDGKLAI